MNKKIVIDSKNKMYRNSDTNAVINNDIRSLDKFKRNKKISLEQLLRRIEKLEKILGVENN